MARSRRHSEVEPRSRTAYSPPPSASRYDRRGSAPEPRSRRRDGSARRPTTLRGDSDYDPRDKYYLSGDEDDDVAFRPSKPRSRESARRSEHGSRPSSSDRYYDTGRRASAGSSTSHASSRHSRSGAGGRGRDHDRERYYPPSASRNQDMRAGKRPGASRTSSWSRSSSGSGKSINSKTESHKDKKDGVLGSALRCAVEAGAITALKQRNDPSPWIGMKGTKVAAAAIGAAAIDTFMERKAPKRKGTMSHVMMRQATTMALGNLVLGPAAKGTVMGRTAKR